ncbi:hypothetical protein K450DRAFT_241279 [Umbelopsis ramanniana AG]|uniref:Uncharacterized protein n=1 Tax=Umbelopsis ramanniana AG TaxID=1314678 RepID=A0AAD5E8Y2_UMBRA|nr:uncharacterized protein K450DRAFT_241279 [Umbelopsis ramanniana AG]KAI8579501.1 hypothetical protein K450DRAFT_241279 [Umbelopsis ramanniana AG]
MYIYSKNAFWLAANKILICFAFANYSTWLSIRASLFLKKIITLQRLDHVIQSGLGIFQGFASSYELTVRSHSCHKSHVCLVLSICKDFSSVVTSTMCGEY